MRICQIQIERFLGIRNLDLALAHNLQFIAGPNNSCKSTVLKAINAFFSGFDTLERSEYLPQNHYYEREGNRAQTRLRLYFCELNANEVEIFNKAWLPRKHQIWIEVKTTRTGVVKYAASNNADGERAFSDLVDLFELVYVPTVRAGTSDVRQSENAKLFFAVRDVLSRRRSGALTDLQREFRDAANQLVDVVHTLLRNSTDMIRDGLPTNTDIDFNLPDSSTVLDLILSKTAVTTRADTDLTIEDEGTGLQSILSLGVLRYLERIMTQRRNLLLLIEEPEAFLHPQFQRSIASYIKDLARKQQTIVTTHSPVIVDSVDLEYTARLERDEAGLDYLWEWSDKERNDAEYLSRYCDTKNSEVVFADKVIVCEGISDEYVLDAIINRVFDESLYHQNISIIKSDGSTLRYVLRLLEWFAIPHIAIVDKDIYTNPHRNLLKNICRDKGKPLTAAEFNRLDRLRDTHCASLSEAAYVRDAANRTLSSRQLYSLGADMEGAVIHSFSKQRVLKALLNFHLSKESVEELRTISGGIRYYERVDELCGAKGWNTRNANRNNKPKPHVLHNVIRECEFAYRRQSDLKALTATVTEFLGS